MPGQKMPFHLDVVSVRLVKDAPLMSEHSISSPEDAVSVVSRELCTYDRETVVVINLNQKHLPINCSFVSMGDLATSIMHPREMLKAAILSNAAAMVMLHNHPSGCVVPSSTDVDTTKRMIGACSLVGIPLLDHIIVGRDGNTFFSFLGEKVLDF